jgi:hypothetical protein
MTPPLGWRDTGYHARSERSAQRKQPMTAANPGEPRAVNEYAQQQYAAKAVSDALDTRYGIKDKGHPTSYGTPLFEILAKEIHEVASRARDMAERAGQLAGRVGVYDPVPGCEAAPVERASGAMGVIAAGLEALQGSLAVLDCRLRDLERM